MSKKPKITLIILESLCGKIAKDHKDKIAWGSREDKLHYNQFTKQIGTVIMGSTTFKITPTSVFDGRKNIIMTSKPEEYEKYANENYIFMKATPQEVLEYLETQGIEEAALVGGGKVNNSFLEANCVDEIYITIGSKIFGQGIPSFGDSPIDVDLELLDYKPLGPNELLLHYKVVK
jgi:dihydrofolate reductase